ncbi:hypothetical protein GALMADRAFT_159330 [Galerina marginata CBS 339.88]|uniref:Uncharacterized protein n=1 Tax=Galerina marginata (strain CBS 339.88) TaxID=685588 RepID=A0A067SKS9_GALM3|nr:hypothetical protein GALMADRAFT_159330 [Galerina marginata CBS 339.88]
MEAADFVIVDDTDPAIKYGSGWALFDNEGASLGHTGGALYNTLHGTTSQTKFTFTYNGALGSLFVVGTIRTGSPASWNCTVDNKPIPTFQPKEAANHFKMCGTTASPGMTGDHTLQFNVNPLGESAAFFDYVLYTPAPTSGPQDQVFNSSNARFQYSQHWVSTLLGQVTPTAGEKLEFDFNGYSLTWFGFFDGIAVGQASATYSLDGLDPITFIIDTKSSELSEMTDQVFFQTPTFDLADHHLEVVFQGSSDGIPLSLNRIVVQNDTFGIRLTPTPSNTIGSRPGATSATSGNHGEPTHSVSNGVQKPPPKPGIIVGSIIGVVAVLVCIAILTRRRLLRRINDSSQARNERPEPFHHLPVAESNRSTEKHFQDVGGNSMAVGQCSIPRPSKTRRWAETTASIFRTSPPSSANETETALAPPSHRRPPRLLMHQDSGARVPQPDDESEIIEVPPTYEER